MSFEKLAQQMERLLNKIHKHAPYDELYMEALPLFKQLSILEHQYKTPSVNSRAEFDSATEAHIAKSQRKLMKWARDRDSMPAKILDVYGYLEKVEKTAINFSRLDETFRSFKEEDIHAFRQNFDQMKNFSEKNHAKIFDVQANGEIIIWPAVRQYVEHYWDIRMAGEHSLVSK